MNMGKKVMEECREARLQIHQEVSQEELGFSILL